MRKTHLFSLVNRILFLFAALVLVLFLIIFIFAYNTTKSEYEQKVYYKIERVGILLERELRGANVRSYQGRYKIGEVTTIIRIEQKNCRQPVTPVIAAACNQVSGFIAEELKNDHIDTYYLNASSPNTNNNSVIQVSVLHSHINAYVLKLTSQILLPYLIISPLAIIALFVFLLNSLKPLRSLEQEIQKREPNFFGPLATSPSSTELNSLVNALNQLFERAHQFQIQQQQFIANAAHELRTPLTALNLHLQIFKNELMSSGHLQPHEQQMFSELEERLQRLQLLVNQMMSLAHQEKLGHESGKQPVELSALVKSCIEQLYPSLEKKQLNLYITDFEKSWIMARPDQLNSIVMNIVDNAIKYTPKGGLISISLKEQSQQTTLIIEDSGPGIDESEYQNVFQRFYRLNNAQDIIGSGLGLAIVHQAVQQLQGTIQLSRSMLGGLAVILMFKSTANAANPSITAPE
ncbi:sensor histidine kinase [Alkanindiges illinoisensis]|uniref:histidine kinase n=1 Tax=Alkanindiges illinoisensis TaxID=197183 RepID=A0A4Y7XF33_9GAMM|nr:HAMP domain-containing sensor histidine kinase [Alkanindiges illinoisensis]TEU30430.1 HAMP domain-containing histidine kinase [Alkanindiges illinoisensis]